MRKIYKNRECPLVFCAVPYIIKVALRPHERRTAADGRTEEERSENHEQILRGHLPPTGRQQQLSRQAADPSERDVLSGAELVYPSLDGAGGSAVFPCG